MLCRAIASVASSVASEPVVRRRSCHPELLRLDRDQLAEDVFLVTSIFLLAERGTALGRTSCLDDRDRRWRIRARDETGPKP